jgi:hypothetical protein
MNTDIFIQAVIKDFKKVKPVYDPPHDTIFAVAERLGYKATVDGFTAKHWEMLKQKEEDDEIEDKLEVLLVKGPDQATIHFNWVDFRELEVYSPRTKKTKKPSKQLQAHV